MSRTGTTTRDRTSGRTGATRAAPAARRTRPETPAARRRRWAVRAALALTVLALLAWLLWSSPVLAVRTVAVDGARSLGEAEVVQAAGVREGTPLLRVDVAAVERRVARLPQVAGVEVTRGWPHSVVVTVVERVPVALVERAGTRTLLDAEGVPFDTVTGPPPPGVVVLEVAGAATGDPATRAALAAVSALPAELRERVTSAAARTGEDVRLTLADGTTVLWGDAGAAAEKARVLDALLDRLAAGALEPAGTIDVSAPSAVVLR